MDFVEQTVEENNVQRIFYDLRLPSENLEKLAENV